MPSDNSTKGPRQQADAPIAARAARIKDLFELDVFDNLEAPIMILVKLVYTLGTSPESRGILWLIIYLESLSKKALQLVRTDLPVYRFYRK